MQMAGVESEQMRLPEHRDQDGKGDEAPDASGEEADEFESACIAVDGKFAAFDAGHDPRGGQHYQHHYAFADESLTG